MGFQRFHLPLALVAMVGLAGCIDTPQAELPAGASAKYAKVALVPGVSDRVMATYWSAALSDPKSTEDRMGWNASAATADLVRAQLAPRGAKITVTDRPGSAAAKGSDVVLVLQQTPLNKLGQPYNPGRDFFALGGGLFAIVAVAGAEKTKDTAFQPRFVLWVRNPAANKAMIGENACTVGLTAALVNPATGEKIGEGVQFTGRETIPGDLSAPDWAGLPRAEKAKVITHCRAALRSAVSQVLVKLDLLK